VSVVGAAGNKTDMSTSTTPYTVGGRCLAYHGPLLYEAKVVKIYDPTTKKAWAKAHASEIANGGSSTKEVSSRDVPADLEDENAYFVHYKGWKSTWDEWVDDSRVLMWNEENIRTQKQLKQKALEAMNRSRNAKTPGGPGSGDVPPPRQSASAASTPTGTKRKQQDKGRRDSSTPQHPRKRRHTGNASATSTTNTATANATAGVGDMDIEREADFIKRPEISLVVPDVLKAQLVDDWEYVTKEHQLVPLPRSPNVVDILKMYRDYAGPKKRQGSADADIFDEVISGLKLYFDRSLGNILLYRFERQQYLEIRKSQSDKSMSEIYGAEHLLRLFVSLPGLIAQTNMDEQGITHLKEHLEDLLRFLVKKQSELFLKEYQHTSPVYESMAKGY
jgi:mortality factor 4-like protein 1